jgi:hypothetical protein
MAGELKATIREVILAKAGVPIHGSGDYLTKEALESALASAKKLPGVLKAVIRDDELVATLVDLSSDVPEGATRH